MKRVATVIIVCALVFGLLSCADMTRTQQTTLSGAAIGARGGALLGAIVRGRPFAGAAIGAGVGALAGYLSGESDEDHYRNRR